MDNNNYNPKIKVIVTSYNNEEWVQTNIESIVDQTYDNYEVLFIDDASSDKTYEIAYQIIGNNSKFKLIKNEINSSKAYSFSTYIDSFVSDDDILLFVDGDDWIAYNNVFQIIVDYYKTNNCWVAYTKFLHYPSLEPTTSHGVDHPDFIHRFNLYRKYPFVASHLKTLKGFLFKKINKSDFKYQNKWIRFADDVAIMCAAMEQSPRDKIKVIDEITYVYNISNQNQSRTENDFKKGREGENYIRGIKPYSVIQDNSNKYVSARMLGRLGNQMFEISAAYSFAIDNNCKLKISDINGVFTTKTGESASPLKYKNDIFKKIDFDDALNNYDIWTEKSFEYEPISYKFEKNLYLNGQFQSEKYFSHNREKILELFDCPSTILEYINQKYFTIINNSVSLHIRRGDYELSPEYHPILSLDYYKKALDIFVKAENILIFSDDTLWAKKYFNEKKFTIIENEKDYIDLYLMSLCTNNIIANSSFSWWGAWLNKNPNKIVVAPKNWFGPALTHNTKDLLPESWITI